MNTKDKLEELRADAYRAASDAVGVPDSANNDAHAAAFHEHYAVALAAYYPYNT